MAEKERILFSYKEIVECLIKENDIHEGIWAISIGFEFGVANVGKQDDSDEFMPAAIVPISKIGIERVEEESNLTVNAAEVNPKAKGKQTKSSGKKTK